MRQIDRFKKLLESKSSWGTKELINNVCNLEKSIIDSLQNKEEIIVCRSSKIITVEKLKKYDILYVSLAGSVPHYFIVFKISKKLIYGVFLSSTYKDFVVHTIENDRFFKDSYITGNIFCVERDTALNSFVRSFESKKEAREILIKVKKFNSNIF